MAVLPPHWPRSDQWRSQGGGAGGPWPPKLLVNVFSGMNWCCYVLWMCKQTWEVCPNFRECPYTAGDPQVARKCTKNVPEWRECDWFGKGKNFCYYPPPPHWMRSAPGEMTENVPGAPPNKNPGYAVGSAAANTAVMPPMIAVAPPSNRSCNSMGLPCPLSHRCGSAAPRRKSHVWRVEENCEQLLAVSLRWWRFWPKTVVAPRLRCDGCIIGPMCFE